MSTNYAEENGNSSPEKTTDSEASHPAPIIPGKNGTYWSFFTVAVGIVASIIAYAKAPDINGWSNGCPSGYENSCKANSAVLRISLALTVLFGSQVLGTLAFTRYFDLLWILKFSGFVALAIGLFFADSHSFNSNGYAWFARITGFLYLILQQIILLDLAYTWNERWLAYAAEDGEEKGQKWLVGIVIISFILFAGAYSVLGVLFWQFKDCDNNVVILSLSTGLTFFATIVQLFFSEEGSILTSAIMTAYCSYVSYSAVILNPSASCNPTLHSGYQTVSTIIGLALTVLSLLWTTYSSVNKIPQITDSKTGESIDMRNIGATSGTSNKGTQDMYEYPLLRYLLAEVSGVFLLVSGYYAMILTNWATLQNTNSLSDAKIGKAALWLQASGQFIAITIYLWSLIAPKILTNREF